jgi:hypothetical protein
MKRLERMRADGLPRSSRRFSPRDSRPWTSSGPSFRTQLVQERLFHELVYPRVAVTEEEIRAELDAHPELLQDPSRCTRRRSS